MAISDRFNSARLKIARRASVPETVQHSAAFWANSNASSVFRPNSVPKALASARRSRRHWPSIFISEDSLQHGGAFPDDSQVVWLLIESAHTGDDPQAGVLRLGVLLAQEPGALLDELSLDGPIPATPPAVPVGLPSESLRRRPDVRRAERQLAAATADIGVQTTELFPELTLLGTGGFQSDSASDWFTGGGRYWSAGPTITR
jgi:hypothetical protein